MKESKDWPKIPRDHKSSFIPRASHLWNSLPPTTFPESYNVSSFKYNINKLDLVFLSTQTFPISSVFPLLGLCYRPYGLSPAFLERGEWPSSPVSSISLTEVKHGCVRPDTEWATFQMKDQNSSLHRPSEGTLN